LVALAALACCTVARTALVVGCLWRQAPPDRSKAARLFQPRRKTRDAEFASATIVTDAFFVGDD